MKAQGFTLIELLAVIVILAIIALIATPIVLGIIDDAKESAQIRSAEMYLKGVANAVMKENLEQEGNFKPTECTITSEGNLYCDDKEGILEVEVDGEKPINGNITFEEGKIKEVSLEYETATIIKNEDGSLEYQKSIITYISLGNFYHKTSDGKIEIHDNLTTGETCTKCNETVLVAGIYEYGGGYAKDDIYMLWEELKTGDYYIWIEEEGYEDYNVGLIHVNSRTGELYTFVSATSYIKQRIDNLNGKLIVSNEVTSLGNSVFEGCINLYSVELPNTITSIGDKAFAGCTGLTTIVIPDSVTSISENAFEGCTNLTTIYYTGTVTGSPWGATNATIKP